MHLNPAQEKAVLHKDGPMLVMAGPGSGKTLVITERTRHLVENHNIQEDHILVITFTKAAAVQMKERFLLRMSNKITTVNFGTFHGIYFNILKYAYNFSSANIISEKSRYELLKEIMNEYNPDYEDEKGFLSEVFSEISLVKTGRRRLDDYYSTNCSEEVFRIIYTEYDKRLRDTRLIDFDDMLVLCYKLLEKRQDILTLWQKRFEYILIDEFQDINKIQYDIVRMLAAPQNNLFIVGDDDQSIYGFRGAVSEIMLGFTKDYPNCKSIFLNINYRTTPNIVRACTRLIKHNTNRFSKEIKSGVIEGRNIVIMNFDTLADENQRIVEDIITLNKEGISLNEMAVLVRTNISLGLMLHKLVEYNIPFKMKGKIPNIYDHFITKDIITYIMLAMGSRERGLFLQIINRPKRYISRECFDTPYVNLKAIRDYYDGKEWMQERLAQLEYDFSIIASMSPYAAINYIRRGIGYEEYLREYANTRKIKCDEMMNVIDELQESSRPYKCFTQWFEYIEDYKKELYRQAESKNKGNDEYVTIATMHNSKGLEFMVVFIMDANEGIIPHKKAVLEDDIEEERRLFYVAMTRAKEYLYIYSARERYNKVMVESRFINELSD